MRARAARASGACAFRGIHPARWPGVTFRDAHAGDLPLLARIYASARADEMARVDWPDAQKAAFLEQQCRLQDEHYRRHYVGADLLLVLLDGEPVGRVYVHRTPGDLRLMEITLLPEHRGRGLGRSLLAELIDESERTHVPLTLHVEPDNPARAWYERLGFRQGEDRGVYWFMVREPAGRASIHGGLS